MIPATSTFAPRVFIACGGTGGHLFPGLAVGAELRREGARVALVVSEKEVDQAALRGETRFDILRLPAAGLGQAGRWAVLLGFWRSLSLCRREFAASRPDAVLAMGGFTCAAPMIAGRWAGASLFLHDSNAVAGRVNRWLSRWTEETFIAFPQAAARLHCRSVTCCGTPVRERFQRVDSPAAARLALGLDPVRPVLLIMGGSQGARGVNEAVLSLLPRLKQELPDLQLLHLAGAKDFESVQARYQALKVEARVMPFLEAMELALAAATVGVSRAGGSSVAEMAAMACPCILIPYPAAADDHQRLNAAALAERGAALWLGQSEAQSGKLLEWILRLLRHESERAAMAHKLSEWHAPDAARRIAQRVTASLRARAGQRGAALATP
ncbi:MAG: UDP-N-acetylglucosamine--N-acetylmuramyl-(pentapeptide) pyrophosphoryl-undecaprenol N-acetylglucosamine transferase [Verrucomicrobia bacterium]|nr:UDP-N-acetylglucosamine--N-acetylmuramyl-(pentapeptide) pyrophosphoryl-undecaprenol N-acetylglucosamine transferase [Verrucomicrobiota bacterium]MBI3867733.1 UDP-N-acetylglucosamine--N-acetylmuramyl-(pentapeptide) pyrophosphoryl-undecaprenol N-acetylglucosamine transferase [Verrucomicrobiota bacterium]